MPCVSHDELCETRAPGSVGEMNDTNATRIGEVSAVGAVLQLSELQYTDVLIEGVTSTFTTISTRTDPYKYSFFPRTICDWNSLSAQSRLQLVPGLSC